MKYIVMLADGMAGRPLEELGGRTTMEAAVTPVMDRLAKVSEIGMVSMVPQGMAPGSDTANLSVLGYDPKAYYSGRSPLEALSIGVDMKDTDVSFRCNLVTLSQEEPYEEKTMIDHSSDEISTQEAAVLLEALKEGLTREGYDFYQGISYRHLLVWSKGEVVELTPPHDILTKKIGEYLPEDEVLRDMMVKSYEILENHPINIARKEKGLRPANSAWFWGAGTRPALTDFEEKTGKRGAMISAVDLLKGIAVGAGMKNISVEGANGGLHTNYEGKAKAAASVLLDEGYDFVYIHVEAPDEMGHQGSAADKVKAIENIDEKILSFVTNAFEKAGEDYRMLILPDHPTPVEARTHTEEPVPYLLYDSTKAQNGMEKYQENTADKSGILWNDGYRLIDHLFEC
ncbi:MAG: cofactor-independent phosphoglycerate mutase [Lachnospiraceae bacterium]|nr:cofactor-independent phosphoglycerate mutase [Lachnospiraceae bacterium]